MAHLFIGAENDTADNKKDLWLALFSLDSYHRGYDSQINTTVRSVTHLGNAEIKNYSLPTGSEASGFYAQTYDITAVTGLSGSNTVIAYRGTDSGPTGGSDIWFRGHNTYSNTRFTPAMPPPASCG